MEETGLIFAKNVPIEGAGESLVTLCVSMASLLVFNGFSKSACFPKKFLTWPVFDYILRHLLRGFAFASTFKIKI